MSTVTTGILRNVIYMYWLLMVFSLGNMIVVVIRVLTIFTGMSILSGTANQLPITCIGYAIAWGVV